MELIERIGSLLGLVAFFGLTILALLYFSQARDVRRLREWAGRAPERAVAAAEQAASYYAQQAEGIRRERRDRGRRVPQARYLALIGGGVIIFGAGIAVGVAELVSDEDASTERAGGQRSGGGGGAAPVVPGNVRVAVLNGTDQPGLAAKVGDDVEANGFQLGTVTNSEESYEFTVAVYNRGHKREAQAVADSIGVSRVRLMAQEIQVVAGDAPVAVVVGVDRADI